MPSTERYERLEPLGAGGMASVFRGHDRLLDRPVAIKVLHPELARRAPLRARFLREARIFAQLKHPHIVDIYDVLSEGDEVAMVMELVEGDDLKGILKRHAPLIPPLAALVIEPVAEALAYAHARGVIHRDVKPANILMGADGVVKLSDFGIAKAANQEDNLTQTGELLGTPAYIAPEQAQGAAITPAVDQYALGVVLYQLVTGEQPFKAPNTMAVLTRIVLGNYTDPRQLSPNVDEPLARIISRALKLDPQARFPDVGAFLSALAVYQAHLGAARRAALLSSLVEDPAALDARLSASLRVGGLAGPGVALLRPPSAPPPERPSAQPPAPDLTSSDVYGGESSGDVHSADRSASLSASLSGDVASRRPPRWPLALGAAALLGALALFFVAPAPPSPTAVVTPAPLDAAAPPHDALLKHDAPPDARPLDAAPSTPPPSTPPPSKPPPSKPPPPPSPPPVKPSPVKPSPVKRAPAKPAHHAPAPVGEGALEIHCTPWADIYIDGQARGRTPPAQVIKLKAGSHTLEVRNPGLDPLKETIQIQGGQTLKRKIRLRRSR